VNGKFVPVLPTSPTGIRPPVRGDLDIVSEGIAYEVKGGLSAFGSNNDFYKQLLKDATAAKDLGFSIGLAYPAKIGVLDSKFLRQISKVEEKLGVTVTIKQF